MTELSESRVLNMLGVGNEFQVQGGWLRCPVCGTHYIHFTDITNIPGEDNYKASNEVRGDVIAMPFECEMGHSGTLNFGFHKGFTKYWIDNLVKR